MVDVLKLNCILWFHIPLYLQTLDFKNGILLAYIKFYIFFILLNYKYNIYGSVAWVYLRGGLRKHFIWNNFCKIFQRLYARLSLLVGSKLLFWGKVKLLFTAVVVNLSMTAEPHQSSCEHILWNILHCHTAQILGNGCPVRQETL